MILIDRIILEREHPESVRNGITYRDKSKSTLRVTIEAFEGRELRADSEERTFDASVDEAGPLAEILQTLAIRIKPKPTPKP